MHRQMVFRGKLITVHVDEQSGPDGTPQVREVVEHAPGVALVALTPDDRVLLVRQPRHAVGDEALLELPAGLVDPGETAEATGRRELREETGWRAGSMEKLVQFYTSPGFTDEAITLYLATDLEPGRAEPESSEDLEVLAIPRAEVPDLLGRGAIRDAKTLVGLLLLLRRFPTTRA